MKTRGSGKVPVIKPTQSAKSSKKPNKPAIAKNPSRPSEFQHDQHKKEEAKELAMFALKKAVLISAFDIMDKDVLIQVADIVNVTIEPMRPRTPNWTDPHANLSKTERAHIALQFFDRFLYWKQKVLENIMSGWADQLFEVARVLDVKIDREVAHTLNGETQTQLFQDMDVQTAIKATEELQSAIREDGSGKLQDYFYVSYRDKAAFIEKVRAFVKKPPQRIAVSSALKKQMDEFEQRHLPVMEALVNVLALLPKQLKLSSACLEMIQLGDKLATAMYWTVTLGVPQVLNNSFKSLIKSAATYEERSHHSLRAKHEAVVFASKHDCAKLEKELKDAIKSAQKQADDLQASMLPELHKKWIKCEPIEKQTDHSFDMVIRWEFSGLNFLS